MIENCPVCSEPGTMLVYGLPGFELGRAADAGRVGLGGCMVGPGQPNWYCRAGHRWRDEDFDGRAAAADRIPELDLVPVADGQHGPAAGRGEQARVPSGKLAEHLAAPRRHSRVPLLRR